MITFIIKIDNKIDNIFLNIITNTISQIDFTIAPIWKIVFGIYFRCSASNLHFSGTVKYNTLSLKTKIIKVTIIIKIKYNMYFS